MYYKKKRKNSSNIKCVSINVLHSKKRIEVCAKCDFLLLLCIVLMRIQIRWFHLQSSGKNNRFYAQYCSQNQIFLSLHHCEALSTTSSFHLQYVQKGSIALMLKSRNTYQDRTYGAGKKPQCACVLVSQTVCRLH